MEPAASEECGAHWPVTCINWFDHLVIGRMEQRWLGGECSHRPDHVNTHKEDIFGQPLRCVESNLVCVNGSAQLTDCDSHLNSSISSLTTCLSSDFPGQITRRTPLHTDFSTTQLSEWVSPRGEQHLLSSLVELVARPSRLATTLPLPAVSHLIESFPLSVTCISPTTTHTELHQANCDHSIKGQMVSSCAAVCDDVESDSPSPVETFRLYCVDKSVSISEQSAANETQDLNSIYKYLPTSDRSDLGQRPDRSRLTRESSSSEGAHKDALCDVAQSAVESTARYRVSLPSPAKTCTVRPLASVFYHLLLFVLLICQLQSPVQSSANIRAIEKRILDSIIGDGRYDSRIRPMGNASVGARGGDGPAVVNVNLLIRSISRIDDVVMEYSVQVTFREQWIDSRLKFDNMGGQIRYLVLTDPAKVWRPDLFFKNEKEGHFHEIIMPNVLLRIHPQGDVLYSIRISLVLACPMNLKYYPLDKQICSIQMASYGYTTEDLMFVWKKEDAVQINTDLHLPRFTLEKYLTDYCTSKTNTGSYSCLKVDLLFKREFSYYLIQIYIPCCMLVIVSWVSFWLDPNAIPARVSLGVTTLLTMATSISGINSSLPPVSYTKAIDVWTGVCLTFVFGALLEFALVNYASRSDAHRAALKQQQAAFAAQRKWDLEHAAALEADHIEDRSASAFAMRPLVRQHGDGFHGEKMRACEIHVTLPKRNWCKRWLSKFPTRSKRIDVISRIFFPLMFALFNLVYWTTYLFREDMQDLA